MKSLNHIGQKFVAELEHANAQIEHQRKLSEDADKVHVTGVGASITKAYEQLRNASENSDEVLLLQRAIRRFYRRLLITPDKFSLSGVELVSELTMAGYLKNDTVTKATATKISALASEFFILRKALEKHAKGDDLEHYVLDVLSVKIEALLNDHSRELALSNLAYNYFLEAIDEQKLFGKKPNSYEAMLLYSTQKDILRYDSAVIRANLIERYQIGTADPTEYLHFNKQLDKMFADHNSDKLVHFVDRRGAIFRVLARMIDDRALTKTMGKQDSFLNTFQIATEKTYSSISKSINKGVWRSILFLLITKSFLAFLIEAPYDVVATGEIAWLPLMVNLLFPPIYMYILRLSLIMPGYVNTTELSREVDRLLYSSEIDKIYLKSSDTTGGFSKAYSVAYTIIVLLVAGGVGYYLYTIGFQWVQLLIFYIFVSAASFLGFRLSRWIREVETIDGQQSFVTTVRDLLYMPFVAIGQWVSEKYAKVAFVSRLLDLAIELPLKTILGWLRQWNNFLSAKKDEL